MFRAKHTIVGKNVLTLNEFDLCSRSQTLSLTQIWTIKLYHSWFSSHAITWTQSHRISGLAQNGNQAQWFKKTDSSVRSSSRAALSYCSLFFSNTSGKKFLPGSHISHWSPYVWRPQSVQTPVSLSQVKEFPLHWQGWQDPPGVVGFPKYPSAQLRKIAHKRFVRRFASSLKSGTYISHRFPA